MSMQRQVRPIAMISMALLGTVMLGTVMFTSPRSAQAATIKTVIGFDDLPDLAIVDDQLQSFGVDFNQTGLNLARNHSLSQFYPARSGNNVIADYPTSPLTGVIRADAINHLWTEVGGYVTGRTVVILTAFSPTNQILGQVSTGGENYIGAPTNIPPNQLLQLTFPNIAYITFTGDTVNSNSFTLDDFTFTNAADVPTPALLPGLIGFGLKVCRRQRRRASVSH
jgi:hypothetical protein